MTSASDAAVIIDIGRSLVSSFGSLAPWDRLHTNYANLVHRVHETPRSSPAAITDDYYQILAITGQGSWRPRDDARLWIAFTIRAHHMQAQTVDRRIEEASAIWAALDALINDNRLPDRTTEILYEAVLGYRIRRSGYMKLTGIEKHTATRDLGRLADLGLLHPHGETRGRHYLAGEPLRDLREDCRRRRTPLTDPYPWLRPRLAEGG